MRTSAPGTTASEGSPARREGHPRCRSYCMKIRQASASRFAGVHWSSKTLSIGQAFNTSPHLASPACRTGSLAPNYFIKVSKGSAQGCGERERKEAGNAGVCAPLRTDGCCVGKGDQVLLRSCQCTASTALINWVPPAGLLSAGLDAPNTLVIRLEAG